MIHFNHLASISHTFSLIDQDDARRKLVLNGPVDELLARRDVVVNCHIALSAKGIDAIDVHHFRLTKVESLQIRNLQHRFDQMFTVAAEV